MQCSLALDGKSVLMIGPGFNEYGEHWVPQDTPLITSLGCSVLLPGLEPRVTT